MATSDGEKNDETLARVRIQELWTDCRRRMSTDSDGGSTDVPYRRPWSKKDATIRVELNLVADSKVSSPYTHVPINDREQNIANSRLFITMNSANKAAGIATLLKNVCHVADNIHRSSASFVNVTPLSGTLYRSDE